MKKKDFILIGVIVAVIAIAITVLSLTKKDGDYVIVRVNGNEVARYSLSQDGEYSLNGGTNVLRIEDGKAYLVYANCPDHSCVMLGKIGKCGQTITCLPNRLTITVCSAEESEVELVS